MKNKMSKMSKMHKRRGAYTGITLEDIEKLSEEQLKNLYEIMEANKLVLSPKEKLELFWISVRLLDLDEEGRKKMFYDILDFSDVDFSEEEYEGF